LLTTDKPYTITFSGENHLKPGSVSATSYSSILKELVADEKNDVQSVFYDLVKGTAVGKELECSGDDHTRDIKALLSNRGRLITLLQSIKAHEE